MKIAVLNGSPKGDISVTMQYVKFIQKRFRQHELKIINVSHEIHALERQQERWLSLVDEVRASQGVLWASPVYFFLVPSQLKRFIEMISERQAQGAFQGKFAAALITSMHCMDHTALNYLTGISEDLGMRFVDGFSAEMDDLELPQERTNLVNFAGFLFRAIETAAPTLRTYAPLCPPAHPYQPAEIAEVPKAGRRPVVVLTDGNDPESNLGKMLQVFQRTSGHALEVIDLHAIPMKGGCLGCLHCAYDNQCAYKDGLKQFMEEKLIPAGALIFAGAIQDRYLSWRWKQFFDRSFVYGHIPVLKDKQIAFVMSGPLRQLPNLRQLFEVYVQEQESHLVGFATDEDEASEEITSGLQALAGRLDWALDHEQRSPSTCISTGLRLLFRNFIHDNSGLFHADHRYYQKHGLYRGRGKKFATWSRNLMFQVMCSVPSLRREFQKSLKTGMIADLEKIVEAEESSLAD